MITSKSKSRILIAGPAGAGKSALFDRLAGVKNYGDGNKISNMLREASLVMSNSNIVNSEIIHVTLVDIPSPVDTSCEILASFFKDCDGVLFVVDASNLADAAVRALDPWVEAARTLLPPDTPRLLLANKYDLTHSYLPVLPRNSTSALEIRLAKYTRLLDSYCNVATLIGWSFTVGHRELGDIDSLRGHRSRQIHSPEDMLLLLLRIRVREEARARSLWTRLEARSSSPLALLSPTAERTETSDGGSSVQTILVSVKVECFLK
jgi:hypothetical protein